MHSRAKDGSGSHTIECGEEAAEHFAFEEGYINLNHGSYGTHPIEVRLAHREYQERAEARPDTFVRYEFRSHLLNESRQTIADYIHAPLDTCVLVPNASTGIDTVLRNLVFDSQDAVICFSTIYPAFTNTLTYLAERDNFNIYEIEHTLPLTNDQICNDFETTLDRISQDGKKAKLAVFDTITSLPAVRMPFERLTKLCRDNNILSCIDGAHCVGQLPLNLSLLDPDFFVSNCHKWLYTPRACALLYTPLRNQHLIRSTLPTGFNFLSTEQAAQTNNFVANFAAVATYDDTPYLCIPAALEWRKRVVYGNKTGEEAILSYNTDLARQGGRLVAELLDTEVLENKEFTLGNCAMTNVRLPVGPEKCSDGRADALNRVMNMEHSIAVNVFCYNNALWIRLSAQIYLRLEHFEAAARALKRIISGLNDV